MNLPQPWPSVLVSGAMTVAYAMVYSSLERIWPARKGQPRLRDGVWVDVAWVVAYLFLVPAMDAVPFGAAIDHLGGTTLGPALAAVHGFTAGLPAAAGALLAVIVADFSGYWKHRLFHTRWLWPFHTIHHSSEAVDWLSNERVHPVEGVATAVFQIVPLLLLGFSPFAIGVAGIVRRAHSLYEHANVRFSYGALEHVFVSPTLHRWHHAADPAMVDKNFANVFSVFDWMFGTLRLPDRPAPAAFGLPWVPRGFWGQLWAPFRRSVTPGG